MDIGSNPVTRWAMMIELKVGAQIKCVWRSRDRINRQLKRRSFQIAKSKGYEDRLTILQSPCLYLLASLNAVISSNVSSYINL
jgi:hypothetical protein